MSASPTVTPRFGGLPPAARAYVTIVVAAGALCLVDSATKLQFDQRGLFALLAALGIATSAIKIDLPLGPKPLEPVAVPRHQFLGAAGPWAGAGRVHRDNQRLDAVHVSRWDSQPAASHPLQCRIADADGVAGRFANRSRHEMGRARDLRRWPAPPRSSRRSISLPTRSWWRARSRCPRVSRSRESGTGTSCGARRATSPVRRWPPWRPRRLPRGWFGWLALLAVPLYLVFRSYHTVVVTAARGTGRNAARDGRAARNDRSARARHRSPRRLYSGAHPIDSALRGHAGGNRRTVGRRSPGRPHRRAAARHRQHGRAGTHSVEAGGAHARGVRSRQDSPARRRRDSQERAVRRAGQRPGAEPSRAVGRPRLSRRFARRRHPGRRPHSRHC